jgi:hypothetical protein
MSWTDTVAYFKAENGVNISHFLSIISMYGKVEHSLNIET